MEVRRPMALYTNAVTISAAGVISTGQAVSASDTISAADVGSRGALLIVNTVGTGVTSTVLDPTLSGLGNAGTPVGVVIGTNTFRVIYIAPQAVNLATQVATVTHSATASITAELYRL